MCNLSLRQTGRTTAQLTYAPRDSIYVGAHVTAVKNLREYVKKLGREDLFVCFYGDIPLRTSRHVIVDHHAAESFTADDWQKFMSRL